MNPLIIGAFIFALTLVLLATGMPIAFALGITALFFMVLNDGWMAITFLPETLFSGLDDFTLTSVSIAPHVSLKPSNRLEKNTLV